MYRGRARLISICRSMSSPPHRLDAKGATRSITSSMSFHLQLRRLISLFSMSNGRIRKSSPTLPNVYWSTLIPYIKRMPRNTSISSRSTIFSMSFLKTYPRMCCPMNAQVLRTASSGTNSITSRRMQHLPSSTNWNDITAASLPTVWDWARPLLRWRW